MHVRTAVPAHQDLGIQAWCWGRLDCRDVDCGPSAPGQDVHQDPGKHMRRWMRSHCRGVDRLPVAPEEDMLHL